MGIVVRQSILTSVISYLGIAIGYINILYLFPKYLSLDEIGLLRTIQDTAMLFAPFAVFGLGQSVIKFLPRFAASRGEVNRFMTLILVLSLGTFALFVAAFYLLEDVIMGYFRKNAAQIIVHADLILLFTFFLVVITLLEQFSRSLLQVALPVLLRDVVIRMLQAALVVAFVLGVFSFSGFLAGSVWIYFVVLLILATFLVARKRFRPEFGFSRIPSGLTRDIAVFSLMSFVGTSSMILIGKMDSIMVTGMVGLPANAIYTTAFYIATVIEVPKRAITTTASPLIARAFTENNMGEIGQLYRKTSINQFIAGALLLIGIYANLGNMFEIMPKGEEYANGAVVILIVGAAKLIDMVFGPSSEIIGLSKYYWFNLVVITLLAGLIVTTNYLLIPHYGINGAAFGSFLSLLLYNAAKYIFIYLRFGLQPFTGATLKVIAISAAALAVDYVIPPLASVFADIIVRSGAITLVFGALILVFAPSRDVNKLAEGLYRRAMRITGRRS